MIGHNNPPDPIDTITAAYEAERMEAENWLDGSPVETEAQMHVVDALRQAMRKWRLDLEKGQKSAAAPLHDAWKAELARWKPTLDDAQRIEGCLVAAVDGFKKRLAAKKEAERRAAWDAAETARKEAEAAAALAAPSDLEAQRQAESIRQAALDAEAAAQTASRDKVKGMRQATRYQVLDHRALLHWIARNDRDAITAFVDEWARKNHKENRNADGLKVWQELEAY